MEDVMEVLREPVELIDEELHAVAGGNNINANGNGNHSGNGSGNGSGNHSGGGSLNVSGGIVVIG